MRKALTVALAVGVAVLVVAGPVAADTVLSETGTVGVYSLTDRSDAPGAIGKYRYDDAEGFGALVRFFVNPPHMRAVDGKTAQTVGWLFKVERKGCGLFGCGRWILRYTSPEQIAVTDDAHNASFSQATVRVRNPCPYGCADGGYMYRITVKMFWHRRDGTVEGSVRDRIYWYGAHMTNGESGVQEKVAGDNWGPD